MRARLHLRERGPIAFAFALFALFAAEILATEPFLGNRAAAFGMAAALCGAMAAVNLSPVLPAVVTVLVISLADAVSKTFGASGVFVLAIVGAFYLAGRRGNVREFIAASLLVATAIPIAIFSGDQQSGVGDILFFVAFFGGPLLVGRAIRHRIGRERVLAVRAVQAEHERDVAIVQERLRIARELHDVVAHSLNVIVLQARGARSVLETAPEDSASALDAIEYLGRQGLDEMRRMLGMLREDDSSPSRVPQPSLKRVSELAAAVSASGLPVEVEVSGIPVDLPPGLDVSAYRIVQEALTNALKHAGHASATVRVQYGGDRLKLVIDDTGPGGATDTGGHGLAGMQERVSLYGGKMTCGDRPGGGFQVKVALPVPSA